MPSCQSGSNEALTLSIHHFCCLLIFFKINLYKRFFQEYHTRVSNSLDPDQARLFVGPDLGPKFQTVLQRSSEDGTEWQTKIIFIPNKPVVLNVIGILEFFYYKWVYRYKFLLKLFCLLIMALTIANSVNTYEMSHLIWLYNRPPDKCAYLKLFFLFLGKNICGYSKELSQWNP